MKRVVITGAGTINPLGHTVPATLEAMREGRCGIGPLEMRDVERLSIRIGGQVKDYDPDTHYNRQQQALYDRFTQFTLLSAREASRRRGSNSRASLRPRQAWSSAPRAAGSPRRTRTTAPSTRRGRTASTPSSCRS